MSLSRRLAPSTRCTGVPFTVTHSHRILPAVAGRSARGRGVLRYYLALLVSSEFALLGLQSKHARRRAIFASQMRLCRKLLPLLLLLLWAAPLLCLASSPSSPYTPTEASAAPATALPHQHSREPILAAKMTSTGANRAKAAPSTTTKRHDEPPRPQLSKRALTTEPAHIEAVLSRYAGMSPPPANLAQGVAHWDPPPAALQQMIAGLQESTNHKYGPALGLPALRQALAKKLEIENGLDMTGQEVIPYLRYYCVYPTGICDGFRWKKLFRQP